MNKLVFTICLIEQKLINFKEKIEMVQNDFVKNGFILTNIKIILKYMLEKIF